MLKAPQYGVSFVYDGSASPIIPKSLGEPRRGHPKKGDQAVGSDHEVVVEISGRACYDSMGSPRSRGSDEYHAHIRQVNHNSVWGHAYHHFETKNPLGWPLTRYMMNQPGVVMTQSMVHEDHWFLTINVRALIYQAARFDYLERHSRIGIMARKVLFDMVEQAAKVDPQMLGWVPGLDLERENQMGVFERLDLNAVDAVLKAAGVRLGAKSTIAQVLADPEAKELLSHGYTVWYLEGFSRGWSHEHVRHTLHCQISQRSTRYVNESKTDWAWHPQIHAFLADEEWTPGEREALASLLINAEHACRNVYAEGVPLLQKYIIARHDGVDKVTARKQARGAMRGALGNALPTSMIWSTSFAELLYHYMPQRRSRFADGEIRVFAEYLGDQLQERYPEVFGHLTAESCPDGIASEWTGWTEPLSHNNPYPDWD